MLACGVLVVIAGLQLLLPADGPPREALGLAARRTKPVTVPPVPEYPAILASPLFAPDRRPGDPGGSSAPGSEPLAGYAALGVATGRAVATAVVSVPGGKVETLHRGDDMDGWRLIGLDRARLTFERNGARRDLVIGAPAAAAKPSASTQAADQ